MQTKDSSSSKEQEVVAAALNRINKYPVIIFVGDSITLCSWKTKKECLRIASTSRKYVKCYATS